MRQQESKIQIACVEWFRLQYSKYSLSLFAIPNGGYRDKKTKQLKNGSYITYSPAAKRLKDEGALAGVPDLFLSIPRRGYHGMYIEMKYGKNTLSDNQSEFMKAHCKDYYCCICYSIEDFIKAVTGYLK